MWRVDSFGKTLMLGGIGGRRRRGWQRIMIGWHHQLNGHGFGWTSGVGDGQGGLACCGSWGHKESDTTERLNWTEMSFNLTNPPTLFSMTLTFWKDQAGSPVECLHLLDLADSITWSTKVHLVKAMVFPVVMYGCERQTIKKAECRRIDAFELWCWRRLLRVPWTSRIPHWRYLQCPF